MAASRANIEDSHCRQCRRRLRSRYWIFLLILLVLVANVVQWLYRENREEADYAMAHYEQQWREDCSLLPEKLERLRKNSSDYNINCPRFATMDHTPGAGLGHRLSEVIFGILFARDCHAMYLFDNAIWHVEGHHGSYTWLNDKDFLSFSKVEVSKTEWKKCMRRKQKRVKRQIDGQWNHVVNQSRLPENKCNVLFRTQLIRCCPQGEVDKEKGCYCVRSTLLCCFSSVFFFSPQPFTHEHNSQTEAHYGRNYGGYHMVKRYMRDLHARSTYHPSPNLFHEQRYSIRIAWHVRGGDIILNGNQEYFTRIASQITTASTRQLRFRVFFIGERTLHHFPFLDSVCRSFFENQCSFPELGERDSLYYMIWSDVLITSGSSFAYIAALLKSNGGVVLNALSKEGSFGIYDLPEHGMISKNGTIEKPSLLELGSQLEAIHGNMTPSG